MPNQDAILENIRKLMKMGLAGNELLTQLEGMGIPRPQAERWVREATNPAPSAPTQGHSSPAQPLMRDTPGAESFAQGAAATRTVPTPPQPMTGQNAYQNPAPTANVERLWEKGIIATVDAKLAQMEQLKKGIDNVIERKVEEHYSVVEKKLETMFEAQRELFKFKLDAQLESKVKDMDEILNQKIEEIRQINLATKEDLQRLRGQKMVMGEIMQDINAKVSTLDETKRAISTDVAQKLEAIEERVNSLMDQTDERVKDVENRATKTLELQEKITSGLTEQVQAQANTILEERVKDLREELKNEIIQLKKLGADLASKDIQQTLNEFKALNEQMTKTKADMDGLSDRKAREMDAMLEKKLLNVDKIVNTKMETIVNMKEKDFFSKIDEQSAEMAKIKRELGTKLIEADATMQNLSMFQKQFVETIKKSGLERGELAAEFKKTVDAFNVRADEKIQLMENRLKQLDVVVNQLSSLMTQWGAQGMGRPATPTQASGEKTTIGTPSGPVDPAPAKKNFTSPPEDEMQEKEHEKNGAKKGLGLFKKK